MKPTTYYTKCDNAKYFKSMPALVDRARGLQAQYNVAHQLLRMYFDVNPEYTLDAEGLAAWRALEWSPWAGWGDTESWLKLKKSIDDEIVQVYGPGATLKETWRRWKDDQANYSVANFSGPRRQRGERDTDVEPADRE